MRRAGVLFLIVASLAAGPPALAAAPMFAPAAASVLTPVNDVDSRQRALIDRLTIERANALAANDARWNARYADRARALDAAQAKLRTEQGRRAAAEAEIEQLEAEKKALADEIAAQNQDFAAELAAYRELMTGLVSAAGPEKVAALERYAAGDRLGAFPVLEQITYAENAARDKAAAAIAAEAEARRRKANADNLRGLGGQALDMLDRGEFTVDRAIPIWKQVAELDPTDMQTWIQLAQLYVKAGNLAEAHKAFDAAVRAAPNDQAKTTALVVQSTTLMAQGDLPGARDSLSAALGIVQKWLQAEPGNLQARLTLIDLLDRLGDVFSASGSLSSAKRAYAFGMELLTPLATNFPDIPELQRSLAVGLNKLGDVDGAQGDLASARVSFEKALAIAETLAKDAPAGSNAQRDLMVSLTKVGDIRLATGDLAGAASVYERGLAIAEKQAAADASNIAAQRDLAVSVARMGAIRYAQADYAGARALFRRSLAISERISGQDASSTLALRDVAFSLRGLGEVERRAGDLAAARAALERAVTADKTAIRQSETDPGMMADMAQSLAQLGIVQLALGDKEAAKTNLDMAKQVAVALSAAFEDNRGYQTMVAATTYRVGTLKAANGDMPGARADFAKALAILQQQARETPNASAQRDLLDYYEAVSEATGTAEDLRAFLDFYAQMERDRLLWPSDAARADAAKTRLTALGVTR